MKKTKKTVTWKAIFWAGLALILIAFVVAFTFQKPIKKQLIELRDWTATKEYNNFKPGKDQVWGIDISHHQQQISWDQLDESLPAFVFLKTTEGATHKDTRYKEYKRKLNEKGIPTGAYHFFSYTSTGIEQAKHFLKFANLKKGDLPPVLDAEFTSGMPGKEKVQRELLAFIQYVENKTGVQPIIYCECDYFNKYLEGMIKGSKTLWISDFWRKPTCDYTFWQKTNKFKHPAFKGTVDYNVFNGSLEELGMLQLK